MSVEESVLLEIIKPKKNSQNSARFTLGNGVSKRNKGHDEFIAKKT